MALALTTEQWIWLTHTLEELNVPVTNTAMVHDNKAAINIAYDHKIGDRSKYIDIAYHLVREYVESRRISFRHVESAETLLISALRDFVRLLYRNFALQLWIQSDREC
jgi:hypothetical protein